MTIPAKSRGSDLQYVKSVGPKRAATLQSAGISTIGDLLYYFPRGYIDRRTIIPIAQLRNHMRAGQPVTIIGNVFRQEAKRSRQSRRVIFFLTLRDDTGFVQCVWFEGVQWYKDAFEVGEMIAVSAIPTLDKLGRPQFVHPEFDRLRGAEEEDEPDWGNMVNTGALIPNYPSGADLARAGLDSRGFRRIIRNALKSHAKDVPEILPSSIRSKENLVDLPTALQSVHFPPDPGKLEEARRRLKFDELFFLELMLAIRRHHNRDVVKGISYKVESALARQLVDSLPFPLTGAQKRVMREIADDMRRTEPMNRLLQGDVGSGKTIVALMAMLIAVDNGYQSAFMAPTEILADQHYRTLSSFLQGMPVSIRLLIGGQRKKLREDILEDVRSGHGQIIVGTHALLEKQVEFSQLGLVVIDEQHRFGVVQRASLKEKGANSDVLVMTATPIPRTLAMTIHGDLDVSVIDEMPAHRKPIKTAIRLEHQKDKVYSFLKQEIKNGRQAYIVFPLVEESEKIDLKAATKEFEVLSSHHFSDLRLGLLHGRMKTEEKDAVMKQFKDRELDILVATTVIEVGIDVPNATVMVIENAERFGLSQLHQLRGRVGRGADQSYCILIANYAWFHEGKRKRDPVEIEQEERQATTRLETMVETNDGFKIAEVDLRLRGPGEFLGTRQSGLPAFRIADLLEDAEILKAARNEAFALIHQDPELRLPGNSALREHFKEHYRNIWELGDVG
ncbi:MAG: ATP-dependent DNA helicase RecG [Bacteroidota bacterium]